MLEQEILGMKLSNPLFLAAGILGTTASSMKMVARAGAGGIVTKSFSIEANDGYDNPTIVKIEGGVINSVGLASPGVEAKKEELKDLNEIRDKTPVIASIYGDSEEVFSDVANQTKDYVDAFELNVSCPHAKCGFGSNIGENPELTHDIVSSVKDNIKDVPIIVKLTPNVTDITEIAKAAEDAGADALTLINSVGPGLRIDYKTARPILNNVFGGSISSRLFQKIREEKGLAYSIYSSQTLYEDCGELGIFASTSTENIQEVYKSILEEIELIRNEYISPQEIHESKEQLKGSYMLDLESTSSRMMSNGKNLLMRNKVDDEQDIIDYINAVEYDDVVKIIKKVFNTENMGVCIVGKDVENINL